MPRRGGRRAPRVRRRLPEQNGDGSVALDLDTVPHVRQEVTIPSPLTVKELSDILGVSSIEVIKALMKNDIMATINQSVDFDTAAKASSELGFEARREPKAVVRAPATATLVVEGDVAHLKLRPPVVTILGHVDHGKTSLLDAIRETNVTATEAGGMTQHIGAYQVEYQGHKITFLDTPGHEAFTAMRARGAQVTDIAVLVVAADDGVMPQTEEAMDHARAAGVPIVVAINKIDKPGANPEPVKRQLAERGLLIEEWGGDVVCVSVSAKKRQGISELLENILVVAEVQELKANPHRPAVGVVIEAAMDKSRGPLATVLVQMGTLKLGDCVVAGAYWGRVKAMFNDKGKHVRRADPSTPVKLLGLDGVPQAGDMVREMPDEKSARAAVQEQASKMVEAATHRKIFSLEDLFAQEGQVKELRLILRTDVQGSMEPIRTSVERLATEKVRVAFIHTGAGSINDSDVLLAVASRAVILGFNTRVEPGARRLADVEGVDIRLYNIIYDLVGDMERALGGLVEPVYQDVVESHSEVRQVFHVSARPGVVAGLYVTDGVLNRGSLARVLRKGQVVHASRLVNLRHFKDDVKEMAAGFECGGVVEGFVAYEVGDIIETYRRERKP
ncbi:MAG: translation initiation factor IF-2 [Chloroflexi bacterium]|nr:translation initiation factor IF-2 [Chloroflexota bacterium]